MRESETALFKGAVKESMASGWNNVLRTLLRLLRETGTRNESLPCWRVKISAIIRLSLYLKVRKTMPSNFSIITNNSLFKAQIYKKKLKLFVISKKGITFAFALNHEWFIRHLKRVEKGRPIRLSARTQDFHSWKRGSIPLWATVKIKKTEFKDGKP